MKIHKLQQPSLKSKTDQLLDHLRAQAAHEAERMIMEYDPHAAVDPVTTHPNQILDHQLDELFHAAK